MDMHTSDYRIIKLLCNAMQTTRCLLVDTALQVSCAVYLRDNAVAYVRIKNDIPVAFRSIRGSASGDVFCIFVLQFSSTVRSLHGINVSSKDSMIRT